MKTEQPELITTSTPETVECTGEDLLVLLEDCQRQGKVVALLQCVGASGYKATVYPKR